MQEDTMQSLWNSSVFDGGNTTYLEALYDQYLEDPGQISPEWQQYFRQLAQNSGSSPEQSHEAIKQQFIQLAKTKIQAGATVKGGSVSVEHEIKQMQVLRLINAYRLQGHLHAQIDPLQMRPLLDENSNELNLEAYGLSNSDLGTRFNVETFVGPSEMPLGKLYQALNDTYCGSIGTEFMYIPSVDERNWIQERIESTRTTPNYNTEKKIGILESLTSTEGLERYLGAKFPGAKRFSLEGGDALIPMLEEFIQRGGTQGVRECVIGMAHRGRLNVLVNILGKDPEDLFQEFEGRHAASEESGDVKYHQGFSSDVETEGGNVHISLAFNPSHLEIVTPVVMGSVRSRQKRARDESDNKVLPIAIHGDAAFAGQGVVMETLNMSQTRGYKVGGTIHIVINNQVGFTTSNPHDARSTLYCTDVAKVICAPVLHVNADDPEAVVFAAQLAFDYRMQFNKDVVIDLVCYRRHGHNEADDPSATQPVMYQKIKKHPTARDVYARQLIEQGVMTAASVDELIKENRKRLDAGKCVAKGIVKGIKHSQFIDWTKYRSNDWREPVKTAMSLKEIAAVGPKMLEYPAGFKLHNRVAKIYEDRAKMLAGEIPLDWGCAEMLAYTGLLEQSYNIRISGQDCGRGTFFHRHAVLHDQNNADTYVPLAHLDPKKSRFSIYDSLLSEEAVLGFEYGYSSTDPATLDIWEAQFGDFANGAQVVIDQFISSGEQKWSRLCGLTMLLPHGYEGQGPEHSSARLERYLQLCAQYNMQVCVPSNASQVFHMLRRQMLRKMRKPLIVMSPKSLLRHKLASCSLKDITTGSFQAIIPEVDKVDAKQVKQVIMCSGKVYYDLYAKRAEMKREDVAIIRIEQLYPFPAIELKEILATYPKATDIVWCQEEPENQGAWYPIQHHFYACLKPEQRLRFAGRAAAASPAAGYFHTHTEQQALLVADALELN